MAICNWPKRERPREILLERGAGALSEAELLAVLIGSGTRNASALEVARSLLCQYGSLGRFYAHGADHRRLPRGIGPARFARLMAAGELGWRYVHAAPLDRVSLPSWEAIEEYLTKELHEAPAEVFSCLHLDGQGRVLALQELYRGDRVDSRALLKTTVRQVMAHNSAVVVLAHRTGLKSLLIESLHSEIAVRLREGLALIDTQLLCHVIVTDKGCFTLRKQQPRTHCDLCHGVRIGVRNCRVPDG